jgi:hypothetical protein
MIYKAIAVAGGKNFRLTALERFLPARMTGRLI